MDHSREVLTVQTKECSLPAWQASEFEPEELESVLEEHKIMIVKYKRLGDKDHSDDVQTRRNLLIESVRPKIAVAWPAPTLHYMGNRLSSKKG